MLFIAARKIKTILYFLKLVLLRQMKNMELELSSKMLKIFDWAMNLITKVIQRSSIFKNCYLFIFKIKIKQFYFYFENK